MEGRHVKIVDGSTVSMPDTEANQAAYPQQPSQQPGLGFPIARLVAVFDLGSGALTTLGVGRYQGKEKEKWLCCANNRAISSVVMSCWRIVITVRTGPL